jgi:hypothetical protein
MWYYLVRAAAFIFGALIIFAMLSVPIAAIVWSIGIIF